MTAPGSIGSERVGGAFTALADAIAAAHGDARELGLAGIANGGVLLARRLAGALENRLGRAVPAGTLDIAFHRDDIGRNPIPKATEATRLPFDVGATTVILCDDVIFSGRTVRASLNELFDQGRPAWVRLAVLCDRGPRHRRLPIHPDFLGIDLDTDAERKVTVQLDNEAPENDRIRIA